MAHVELLVTVFTLLQCSSAEISGNVPMTWYSANVINDPPYSPKPLTEIFSTPDTFSSTNPIVVLSSTTTQKSAPISTSSILSSTPAPPSTTFPFSNYPTSTDQYSSTKDASQPVYVPFPRETPPDTTTVTNQNPTFTTKKPVGISSTSEPHETSRPTTVAPPNNLTNQNSTDPFPTIRIRMLTPAGTITNVNILRGPGNFSTTRKGNGTKRNRRRNRNNFDDCADSCSGRRMPICAAPLSVRPINPDSLKGFPSICHMACNNSFRKNMFEKVADGRCGRLRTRFRTMNSDDKVKRVELNKARYTIIDPGTVIEFSPLQQ